MNRTNELPVREYNLALFHFDKATGELTSEASDLNGFGPGQLWNDACDIGIAVRSPRTDRVERFYLDKVLSRDNEVQGWELKPVDPKCRVKKIIVFND